MRPADMSRLSLPGVVQRIQEARRTTRLSLLSQRGHDPENEGAIQGYLGDNG